MKPKKSSLTECPDDFPITDEMKIYAKKKGYIADLEDMTEGFLLYHQKEGSLFKNWMAAWKQWLRNQMQWYPERNVSKKNQPGEIKDKEPVKDPVSLEKMREWKKNNLHKLTKRI